MGNAAAGDILLEIYQRLIARYGPQYWWPAETPFEVIIGAILTQSAAWRNVEKAISNLKTAKALSAKAFRQLPLDQLARLIHPCGYYNAKALKLKSFAPLALTSITKTISMSFSMAMFDKMRLELLSIQGIGQETAGFHNPLCGKQAPVFVADAYTRRILSRLGLAPTRNSYNAYQALFMGQSSGGTPSCFKNTTRCLSA